ncbi:MAG: hypothetical protein BWY11_01728 [Firmicutes bacterium ADurb.Bin182]|nr:MAG: hypothetical protein BWY11_01728 [Firmicutes bacterium ADurb.Bin182]
MKRLWLVFMCFLFALPFLMAGCGESKEQMLSQYGVETDEQGQYVLRTFSRKWHGELIREEDGSAVFYGRNHDFERHFDAYGNILYDVGTDNVNNFGEKTDINNWAAAGELWPEDAPIPLPENAYAVNIKSFSAFNYSDEPPEKARIGKLSPDEISAYIRLLENDGWQKRFDSGRMTAAPVELASMVEWYLGDPGAGDIILEKDSVFVIIEPLSYTEYSVIDVTFCYARLPDASPLPLPEDAAVEWAVTAPDCKKLYLVCFSLDEAYGTPAEQTYRYLTGLEMNGILAFEPYSEQTGHFSSVKKENKYDLVSDWSGEYCLEGNQLTFHIRWQFI